MSSAGVVVSVLMIVLLPTGAGALRAESDMLVLGRVSDNPAHSSASRKRTPTS